MSMGLATGETVEGCRGEDAYSDDEVQGMCILSRRFAVATLTFLSSSRFYSVLFPLHHVPSYGAPLRRSAMVSSSVCTPSFSDRFQETAMAIVFSTESTSTKTIEACRQSRRHCQRCSPEERNCYHKGCRAVVPGDAARRGDAAQGQIQYLRSEGKEVSKGHTQ